MNAQLKNEVDKAIEQVRGDLKKGIPDMAANSPEGAALKILLRLNDNLLGAATGLQNDPAKIPSGDISKQVALLYLEELWTKQK